MEWAGRRNWIRRATAWVAVACATLTLGASSSVDSRINSAPASGGREAPPVRTRQLAIHEAVVMGHGESLEGALVRAGLGQPDAARIVDALANDFDGVNPHPGLALALALSPADHKFESLSFQARPETKLTLLGDGLGRFHLWRDETPAFRTLSLVQGAVDGSLYLSIVGAGAEVGEARDATSAFGARLDLARDVESGDRFKCVFGRSSKSGGPEYGSPSLLYAELITRTGPTVLYGDEGSGAGPGDDSESTATSLLRTPVDATRVSSPFGMRLHPILGFSRMHQGVDFAAPVGAPVLAAGDGRVEEARWAGGYGRWLKIRHSGELETGYAHLSAWAAGVSPGAWVRRGQVVGYVGATGLVTGPHLHYEVIVAGRRVDPASVAEPARTLVRADVPLRARRASIDAEVAALVSG